MSGLREPGATVARRLRISGRVQGVGYRAAFAAEAQRLGLTGFVRNRRDGSVEAEVAGAARAVDAIIAWARQGPPLARVASVEIEAIEPDATLAAARDFSIAPTV